MVYKAHLQWHLDGATEVVAVKTLKGISLMIYVQVMDELVKTCNNCPSIACLY